MKKKTFIREENPAMQFISPAISNTTDNSVSSGSVDHKKNKLREPRSKRLQLLMKPSLNTKLRWIASSQGISLNELIHTVLDDYTKKKGGEQ